MNNKVALIAGVTGITGGNLATLLASQPDWTVYGISRQGASIPGVTSIAVDLQDPAALNKAVSRAGVVLK
jgi:GDP-D-mannose dehydratase